MLELESLLRALAATGASMLIRVDGERTEGANPSIFTVVITDVARGSDPIRDDDADLLRAMKAAIAAFDASQ